MSSSVYISVYLFDRRIFAGGEFVYLYNLDQELHPGSLLSVEFGSELVLALFDRVLSEDEIAQMDIDREKIKEVQEVKQWHISAYGLALAQFMAQRYFCSVGQALSAFLPKQIKEQSFQKEKTQYYQIDPQIQEETLHAIRGNKQKELIAQLQKAGESSRKELSGFSLATLRSLQEKSIIQSREEECFLDIGYALSDEEMEQFIQYTLNTDQQTVVDDILQSDRSCHLIHGVTGSGKTEVFLQRIEQVLQSGQQCLVLLPEIALTPQTLARFTARFSELFSQDQQIAMLHSGLSDRARASEYLRISENRVPLVIGSRSSIFAPFQNLGLIVMDEVHDESFHQDSTPRYRTL
ncbi:MAG: DEAD/DEAH box helicase, partial [Patescibacteria group bacterium]|nr:DEAD/DEAH box helicase [Patescibacteria group bacterium]